MTNTILVKTTCDKPDVLRAIANVLIEQRLAACCQISGSVTSVYRWEDKIETSKEWVLEIKTVDQKLEAVVDSVKAQHSYDEPEIVATEIVGGSKSYLAWIESETK